MQNHLDLFGLSLVSLKNVLNSHSNFHLPQSSHVLSFLRSPHPFPLDHSLHLSHCKVYQPQTRFSKREFWFWLLLGLKWYNENCFKTTKNTVLTSLINRDSSSEVSKKLSPFASAEKESHIHEHYNVI